MIVILKGPLTPLCHQNMKIISSDFYQLLYPSIQYFIHLANETPITMRTNVIWSDNKAWNPFFSFIPFTTFRFNFIFYLCSKILHFIMPSPPTFLLVEVNLSFNIILLIHIHLHGNLIYEGLHVDIEKGGYFFSHMLSLSILYIIINIIILLKASTSYALPYFSN